MDGIGFFSLTWAELHSELRECLEVLYHLNGSGKCEACLNP